MEKGFVEKMVEEFVKEIKEQSTERKPIFGGLTEGLLKSLNEATFDKVEKYEKKEALEEFRRVCKSFDINFAPFPALNLIGIWGVILENKHGVERSELLKIFTEETGLKL